MIFFPLPRRCGHQHLLQKAAASWPPVDELRAAISITTPRMAVNFQGSRATHGISLDAHRREHRLPVPTQQKKWLPGGWRVQVTAPTSWMRAFERWAAPWQKAASAAISTGCRTSVSSAR